jgi:hypothetical protein
VKPVVALAGLSGLCATLVACGGSPPPPPAATPKPVAAVPAPAPGAAAVPRSGGPATPVPGTVQPAPLVGLPPVPQAAGASYDPKGRRDPFLPADLTGGPKGLDVSTTKLTGIVRSARTTLALVETTDGIGYILKPGDTLGDGRLMEIAADSVIFAVAAKPGSPSNRVVLKLAAN